MEHEVITALRRDPYLGALMEGIRFSIEQGSGPLPGLRWKCWPENASVLAPGGDVRFGHTPEDAIRKVVRAGLLKY